MDIFIKHPHGTHRMQDEKNLHWNWILRVKSKETLSVITIVNLLCFPLWKTSLSIMWHEAEHVLYFKSSHFIVMYNQISNDINIIYCIFHKCLFFFFCTITIILDLLLPLAWTITMELYLFLFSISNPIYYQLGRKSDPIKCIYRDICVGSW